MHTVAGGRWLAKGSRGRGPLTFYDGAAWRSLGDAPEYVGLVRAARLIGDELWISFQDAAHPLWIHGASGWRTEDLGGLPSGFYSDDHFVYATVGQRVLRRAH
jgi:hypothetical protein